MGNPGAVSKARGFQDIRFLKKNIKEPVARRVLQIIKDGWEEYEERHENIQCGYKAAAAVSKIFEGAAEKGCGQNLIQ